MNNSREGTYGHWFSTDRAMRNQLRRDFFFRCHSFRQDQSPVFFNEISLCQHRFSNYLFIIICFFVAWFHALEKSVVTLHIKKAVFVKSCFLKAMLHICCENEIIFFFYQVIQAFIHLFGCVHIAIDINITTWQIIGRRDLRLPGCFLTSLHFHNFCTAKSQLNPCKRMNAVINARMIWHVTSRHAAVRRIDDRVTLQSCGISLPDINAILDWHEVFYFHNPFFFCFFLKIRILHVQKFCPDFLLLYNTCISLCRKAGT